MRGVLGSGIESVQCSVAAAAVIGGEEREGGAEGGDDGGGEGDDGEAGETLGRERREAVVTVRDRWRDNLGISYIGITRFRCIDRVSC